METMSGPGHASSQTQGQSGRSICAGTCVVGAQPPGAGPAGCRAHRRTSISRAPRRHKHGDSIPRCDLARQVVLRLARSLGCCALQVYKRATGLSCQISRAGFDHCCGALNVLGEVRPLAARPANLERLRRLLSERNWSGVRERSCGQIFSACQ